MGTKDYSAIATITIDAPIEKVWDALINPDLVRQYLHDTTVASTWKVGDPITWHGVWNDTPYEDKGTVLAFEPNKLLQTTHWSPMSGNADVPENYHTVSYELTPQRDSTRVVLSQTNNASQEAADNMAQQAWMPILQTMKSILEA